MPYKWSTAAFIKNGMTRGAIGFGNWLYTAIFSHGSVYRQRQDIQIITINQSDAAESGAKRQKPPQYLQWLFELFTMSGDTIIDGFGGSGTSVIVSEKTGRRCICIERDPQSFVQIVERVRSAVAEEVQEAA
jgi:DNA modification methylase